VSNVDTNPELTVVVALISGHVEDLERNLDALHRQQNPPSVEIMVPFDPPCIAVTALADRYPDVQFILAEGLDTARAREGHSREHHDTLRTIGLRAARGRIVALTEDHAVASETWCRDMVTLLDEHPDVAAIGGAVECGSDRLINRAVYYCDFGRYQNPLSEGEAQYVSDSNVAYRREALEAIHDSWKSDYHETVVHGALLESGREIWLTPRSTVWQVRSGLSFPPAMRERYVWGRSFAGTRVQHETAAKRLLYAGFSMVLPLLLTIRIARGVLSKRREVLRFASSLPLIVLLQGSWSLGEFVGYLTKNPEGL